MENEELRKKIHEINNSDLDQKTKNRKIFEIMNTSFKTKEKEKIDHTKIICNHYKRNCSIISPCCKKIFPCRLCHDQYSDHKINRFEIEEIVCRKCNIKQNTSNKCINCNTIFAKYHCNICNLWLDNDNNPVYHCHDCGICRKGEKEDFFHCHKCNLCISKHLKNTHICVSDTANSNCPCCNEYLFNSTQEITILKCGHTMHKHCLEEYVKYNIQCPLCKKSITDLKEYWKQIDQFLENNQMPQEYINKTSNILCNDCETKTITSFHFIYHKCQNCGSYNTTIL